MHQTGKYKNGLLCSEGKRICTLLILYLLVGKFVFNGWQDNKPSAVAAILSVPTFLAPVFGTSPTLSTLVTNNTNKGLEVGGGTPIYGWRDLGSEIVGGVKREM